MLQIYSGDLTWYSNGEWMEPFLSRMQCLHLNQKKAPAPYSNRNRGALLNI
jgi:hypothetical protein